MDYRISYAQNREDLLIAAFFPDVAAGHYVDVGAGHPSELSVTKLLYDRGWSGVNVEPIPELADALRAARPRDVTVQVALAATHGETLFRQYAGSGLSTINADTIAEHGAHPTKWTQEYTEYRVETTTLALLLEQHPLPHVHVLKLDVEGAEYDVLAGADWELCRPELVCIETEHIRRDWFPLLQEAGYQQVFHDGLNAYLLAGESQHRREHFNYAEVVLEGPVIVTPATASELDAAARLRTDIAAAEAESERLRLTVAELTDAVTAESELRRMYADRHADAAGRLADAEAHLAGVLSSTSWRITYPLRRTTEILRARLPRRLLVRLWRRYRALPRPVKTESLGEPHLSPDAKAVLERMRELE